MTLDDLNTDDTITVHHYKTRFHDSTEILRGSFQGVVTLGGPGIGMRIDGMTRLLLLADVAWVQFIPKPVKVDLPGRVVR